MLHKFIRNAAFAAYSGPAMAIRTCILALLLAMLGACERPQPQVSGEKPASAPANGPKRISAAPEHFDRVRAEQFEKEEDRLRRRSRAP
jgi:hypothetical protein